MNTTITAQEQKYEGKYNGDNNGVMAFDCMPRDEYPPASPSQEASHKGQHEGGVGRRAGPRQEGHQGLARQRPQHVPGVEGVLRRRQAAPQPRAWGLLGGIYVCINVCIYVRVYTYYLFTCVHIYYI